MGAGGGLRRRLIWIVSLTTIVAALITVRPQPLMANGASTVEALAKVVAALEARVTTLEARLQRYEGTAEQQASATLPKPMLVSLAADPPQYSPMQLGGPGGKLTEQPVDSGWGGLYWGTSFGYGSAFSKSRYRQVRNYEETWTSNNRETQLQDDGTTETELEFDHSTWEQTFDATGSSKGSDETDGVIADLYLGASALIMPRVVAGFQIEGSLSEMTFDSSVGKEKFSFEEKFTSRDSDVSSDGDTFQSSSSSQTAGTGTRIFPGRNEVDLDWMVSVIGRAGVLATPTTFVYGLGGWSYGHFQVSELIFGGNKIREFNSDGPTVGGGIERKLSPKWSLRAEYRYTDFGSENFSTKSVVRRSQTGAASSSDFNVNTFEGQTDTDSSSSVGTESFSPSETVNSKGSLDNDMHVGRIGVTRYFTLGD